MSLKPDNNKRTAKNTLLLYFRSGVTVHNPSHIECVGSGRLRNI